MNNPDQRKRIGVVLMNLGGPTSTQAVGQFLHNLFLDPDIIKFGGGLRQKLLARFITARRAGPVAQKYRRINACPTGCTGSAHCPNRATNTVSDCCSPINPLTEAQRAALEGQLAARLPQNHVRVFTAMRYWAPDTETTMRQLADFHPQQVVLLPLYPQFSWTTTGSSLREWQRVKTVLGLHNAWEERIVKDYHINEDYIAAINLRIDEAFAEMDLGARRKTHLVFSAHGTPMSEVRSGDPYTAQVRATWQAVMAHRAPTEESWLSYQSRVGPAKWTQPSTEDLTRRLMAYGARHLLIVPVAFVTDHIETLMELNIELREELAPLGLKQLTITRGLNDHPRFIHALAEEVLAKLHHAPAHEAALPQR